MPETIETLFEKHARTPENLIPDPSGCPSVNSAIFRPNRSRRYHGTCEYLRIRYSGSARFYAQFRFTKPGLHSIKVCLGTACHVKGGATLLETMERGLEIKCGETTPDGKYDLDRVACLGCCALSPVVQIDKEIHSRVTVSKLTQIREPMNSLQEKNSGGKKKMGEHVQRQGTGHLRGGSFVRQGSGRARSPGAD